MVHRALKRAIVRGKWDYTPGVESKIVRHSQMRGNEFHAADIQRLLEYGLIQRFMRGYYYVLDAGFRVYMRLESERLASTLKRTNRDQYNSNRRPLCEVPGSDQWREYFKHKTW